MIDNEPWVPPPPMPDTAEERAGMAPGGAMVPSGLRPLRRLKLHEGIAGVFYIYAALRRPPTGDLNKD